MFKYFRIQRMQSKTNPSLIIIHNKSRINTSLLFSPFYSHKYNLFCGYRYYNI